MRVVLLIFLLPLFSQARDGCLLDPHHKSGRDTAEDFQHLSFSSDGFFGLYWNSSGDSAFAPDLVPVALEALLRARDMYHQLPGGWEIPLGPMGHYPVYAVSPGAPGATSYPYTDGGISGLSCIWIHPDPARFSEHPQQLLEVTCAHELFHAYQFAQNFALQDLSFYEASAVWAEDAVFPDHDDWASRYLPGLLDRLEAPLTQTGGQREYGLGALVKRAVLEAGGWNPCREALLAGPGQRAWGGMLASLADGETFLCESLLELIHAGQPGVQFPVEELSRAGLAHEPDFVALEDALGAGTEPWQALEELSWAALASGSSGWLESQADELGLHVGRVGEGRVLLQPAAEREYLPASSWLLTANAGRIPQDGARLLSFEPVSASGGLLIYPNPGGRLRWLTFAEVPDALNLYGLDGRKLGHWRPGTSGLKHQLLLPPGAQGLLLLRSDDGRYETSITVAR